MTVNIVPEWPIYAGNGSTTVFPFEFEIFRESDLEVTKKLTSGAELVLALNADYTVSAPTETNEPIPWPNGGEITTTAAPATGETLAIRRRVPEDQQADFEEGSAFPAKTVEASYDKAVMLVQQLREITGRAFALPVTFEGDGTFPPPGASEFIRWNDAGTQLITDPGSGIAPTPQTGVTSVYNVKDPLYGAIGDGVTIDTPAIQAAIDAAGGAGGGVVYFPPGKALIDASLLVKESAVTLQGDGRSTSVIQNNTAGLDTIIIRHDDYFTGTRITGFRFLNLDLQHDVESPAGGAHLRLSLCALFHIDGCMIQNHFQGIVLEGCLSGWITDTFVAAGTFSRVKVAGSAGIVITRLQVDASVPNVNQDPADSLWYTRCISIIIGDVRCDGNVNNTTGDMFGMADAFRVQAVDGLYVSNGSFSRAFESTVLIVPVQANMSILNIVMANCYLDGADSLSSIPPAGWTKQGLRLAANQSLASQPQLGPMNFSNLSIDGATVAGLLIDNGTFTRSIRCKGIGTGPLDGDGFRIDGGAQINLSSCASWRPNWAGGGNNHLRITGGDNVMVSDFSGFNLPNDTNKATHGILVDDSSGTVSRLTLNGALIDNFATRAFQFNQASKTAIKASGLTSDESSVVAAASTVNLTPAHQAFQIQGTTDIDNIAAADGWEGRTVSLLFQDAGCTVNSGGNLRPRTTFTSAASSTLTFFTRDGATWYELGRAI